MAIDFDKYFDSICPDKGYLFHYTSQYVGMELILRNLKLKFSNSEFSHDPLEKDNVYHSVGGTVSADETVVDDSLLQGLDYASDVETARHQVKYASFSIDKEKLLSYPWDKGCFRSRMWSQYADSHRGMCIVLSRESLESRVEKHLNNANSTWKILGKVRYNNEAFFVNNVGHIDHSETGLSPPERIKKFSETYLFSKLQDYENEAEYRVSFYDGENTQSSLINIAGAVEGVILGHDFSDTYYPVIGEISRRLRIPIVQASWFRGKPSFWQPIFDS